MSFTATRDELVTALNGVTGVKGFEFRPSTMHKGDAWPLLGVAERGPGDAFSAEWRVMLCLGGDERAATIFTDTVLPELVDEIDPIAFVQSVRPVVLTSNAGDIFALELSCISE